MAAELAISSSFGILSRFFIPYFRCSTKETQCNPQKKNKKNKRNVSIFMHFILYLFLAVPTTPNSTSPPNSANSAKSTDSPSTTDPPKSTDPSSSTDSSNSANSSKSTTSATNSCSVSNGKANRASHPKYSAPSTGTTFDEISVTFAIRSSTVGKFQCTKSAQ